MIVPNQFFEVKIYKKNINYYTNLGYDVKLRDIIKVPTEHLYPTSHQKIKVQCDGDGCCETFEREYRNHINIKNGDYCKKCVKKYKTKITILNKYGVENPAQSEKVKQKMKKTNLERYGFEYASQSDIIKNKVKKTYEKKYGSQSNWWHSVAKDKMIRTNMEKYGVPWAMQNEEIIQRSQNKLNELRLIKVSSQQQEIFNILKNNYKDFNIKINYEFRYFNFDIALFNDDIKIDIEYDGWYWHKDYQRDRRRDEVSKSYGWKVLRIKSGHKIPTIEQLEEAINWLINGHSYAEIKLDDWKEVEIA